MAKVVPENKSFSKTTPRFNKASVVSFIKMVFHHLYTLYTFINFLLLVTDFPRSAWLFVPTGMNLEAADNMGFNLSKIPFADTEELYEMERQLNVSGKIDPMLTNYMFISTLEWTNLADQNIRLYDPLREHDCASMINDYGQPSEWDEYEEDDDVYVNYASLYFQTSNRTSLNPKRVKYSFMEAWSATGAFLQDDRFKKSELYGIGYYFVSDIEHSAGPYAQICQCDEGLENICYPVDKNGNRTNVISTYAFHVDANMRSYPAEVLRLIVWLSTLRYVLECIYRKYVKKEEDGIFVKVFQITKSSSVNITLNGLAAMMDFKLSITVIAEFVLYGFNGLQLYNIYLAFIYMFRIVWIQLFVGLVVKKLMAALVIKLGDTPKCYTLFLYQETGICMSFLWTILILKSFNFTSKKYIDHSDLTDYLDTMHDDGFSSSSFVQAYLLYGIPWVLYYCFCTWMILSLTVTKTYQENEVIKASFTIYNYACLPSGLQWKLSADNKTLLVSRKDISHWHTHLQRFENACILFPQHSTSFIELYGSGIETKVANCRVSQVVSLQSKNLASDIEWVGNSGAITMTKIQPF